MALFTNVRVIMKLVSNRYFAGTFRLLLGLAILGSVAWQVTDRLIHNVFRPQEYFTFFTVDTSILVGIVLLVTAYFSFTGRPESRTITLIRMSLVCSYVVVGVVYNALLRGLPASAADAGYVWPTTPNEVLHVWAPALLVVEWLLFERKNAVSFRAGLWAWAYPFAWLGFTLVRGLVDGWWPYFFINPNDKGGVTGMLTYIFGIMAFLYVISAVLIPAQRLTRRIIEK